MVVLWVLAIGICERQQEILILEINNLPGNVQPYHVALSHLTRLRNPEAPFAMAYSYPSKSGLYEQLARQKRIAKVAPELLKALPQKDFLPQGSFLILDPASVEKLREEEEEKEENRNRDYEDATVEDCVEKQTAEWDETVAELETRIEDFIDPKGGKWLLAKNLLKEILRNSNICILENRKEMMLNDIYSTRVSILDFITNAIRRAGPSERETRANSAEYRLYRTYVQALLKNLCMIQLCEAALHFIRHVLLGHHLICHVHSHKSLNAAQYALPGQTCYNAVLHKNLFLDLSRHTLPRVL